VSDRIEIEHAGHVATVWLNRPDARNAFDPELWDAFPGAVQGLSQDENVRAIVIAGRGDAFTVGLDLKAYGPALASGWSEGAASVAGRRQTRAQIKHMQQTPSSVADSPKPVIAAIHSYCLGAGVDLITACDIRLASADAVFSVRETRMGLVADVGTLQRLPRLVPAAILAELVYTGRDFTAEEALDWGFVNRVYPNAAETHKAAQELAAEIAANSPLAVQGSKQVLRATGSMSVDESLDYVATWNSAFLHSKDLAEAVAAFLEKRPPEFKGE
jgi:enoyl-CoA hydratase